MKRLLAMLLAVVMTLSCLPAMAFGVFASEEETTEPTEAILEVQEDPAALTQEDTAPTEEVSQTQEPAREENEPVASVEEVSAEQPEKKTGVMPLTEEEEDDTCGEKLTWALDDEGVLTISGEGAMYDYSQEAAPWSGEAVTEIVVEKGVTSIGAYAFCDMTEVTKVSLPATLLTIDACAFQYCTALETVSLPEKLQGIGDNAFTGCEGLTGTMTIPASVTLVGNGAFSGCTGLTGATVGSGLAVLNKNVFADCENLKNVKLVSGLTRIREQAFAGCSSLKSIAVPDSVIEIDNGAFCACTALESITLPFTGGAQTLSTGDICYPFGYIFGDVEYDDSIAVKQRYFTNTETPTYFTTTYYIPQSLTKVTLSGGDVRPYAFYNCTGLESISLSDTTKNIGNYAFAGCEGLKEMVLPNTLTYIGEGAYDGCADLETIWFEGTQKQWKNIKIGDNNAPLEDVDVYCVDNAGECGEYVNWVLDEEGTLIITGTGEMEDYSDWIYVPWYEYRDSVKKVQIKEGVTSIGGYAFYGHTAMTSVTIADSVETIGDAAFYGCAAVSKIELPEGLTAIGDEAFSGCAKLAGELELPEGLTELGDGAYKNCRKLIGCVTVPSTVETLGDRVFYGCSGLTEVVLEEGIEAIGDEAFYGCSDLIDIQIPDSVASIGDAAFAECENMVSIALPEGLTQMGDGVFSYCVGLEEIQIPEGVTVIGDKAFYGCVAITQVEIPDTITAIGDSAFAQCVSLAEVSVPAADVELGSGIFAGCESLTEIVIPADWTQISDRMFEDCLNLESVTFEGAPEAIGDYAFAGCLSLEEVELPEGITTLGDGVFYGCESLAGAFVIPDSVEEMGSSLLQDCVNLTEVTLPAGITQIPDKLLYGCNSIEQILIPEGVTSIGEGAFNGCVLVDEIELPEGLKKIGSYAFAGCAALTQMQLPDTLQELGAYAFSTCTGLTKINIPAGVKAIGEGAFGHCILLTQMQIPSGVTEIGENAFAGCLSLVSVTIPYSVKEIKADAFAGCTSLNHVLFAGLQSQWDSIVIDETNTVLLSEETTLHMKAKGNEVTVEWTGSGMYGYCSVCDEEMDFGAVNVENCLLYMDQEVVYTGSYIRPQVFLYTVWGEQLVLNTDYTVSYSNNKNIGKAVVTVTGKGEYEGKFTANFSILPPQVKNVKVSSTTATTVKVTYDGVLPASHYDIYVDGAYFDSTGYRYYTITDLTPGQNYTVNVVAVKSIGDTGYEGEPSVAINVRPSDSISKYSASLEYTAVAYDGASKQPNVTLKRPDGTLLTEGEDYVVEYEDNRSIGKAKAIITGINAYNGTITKSFTVEPGQVTGLEVVDITSSTVTISFDPVPGATEYWIYRGGTRRAKISDTTYKTTGLSAGTTYKFYVKAVADVDGDDFAGKASETVTAKPTYTIDDYTFTVTNGPLTYTGKALTPSVKLKSVSGKTLTKGTHYTITCEDNIQIGTATVTATGKGKYSETISTTFEIVPGKVSTPTVKIIDGETVDVSYKAVNGAQWYEIFVDGVSIGITEKTTCRIIDLTPGKTHKITVRAGATVDGEDYIGSTSSSKSVKPLHQITADGIKLSQKEFAYTGKYLRPSVEVYGYEGELLTEGEDYTLKFRDNKNTGKAYVQVTGKGGYSGSVKEYYIINPAQITGVKVKSTTKDSVKLTFNKSSSISYYEVYLDGVYRGKTSGSTYTLNNLDSDKVYEVVMVGRKTVSGTTYYGEESEPIKVWTGTGISNCSIKLEYTTVTYDGTAMYPEVVVKTSSKSSAQTLIEGVDYELVYENNGAPGKAKVIILGKEGSDYTGSITKTFKINPPQVENVTATALSMSKIEVSFDPAPGATSYWVYVNGTRKAKITDTTCTISGLSKNKTYKITVKSVTTVDDTNYTSSATEAVKVTTLK